MEPISGPTSRVVRSSRTGATNEILESHLTHNCNGLSQRRSRSLTSRQSERFNEDLGVLPHLRLKLRILKKVLESHLTYNKILFRSYLNTRSWSPTSLVAVDRNRRQNNKPNCSLSFKLVCVSSN